jgi:hypothetical protein
MDETPLPIRTFLTMFGKWLNAMESNRTEDAVFFADELRVIGRMLAMDPEFHRIFNANDGHRGQDGARYALDCLHAFLGALTEAHLLKKQEPPSRSQ